MTSYGSAFCAMSFTLNKMEEEADRCKLWSQKEISEIIKEVSPTTPTKIRSRTWWIIWPSQRQQMVRVRNYLHFLQEVTTHGWSVWPVSTPGSWWPRWR